MVGDPEVPGCDAHSSGAPPAPWILVLIAEDEEAEAGRKAQDPRHVWEGGARLYRGHPTVGTAPTCARPSCLVAGRAAGAHLERIRGRAAAVLRYVLFVSLMKGGALAFRALRSAGFYMGGPCASSGGREAVRAPARRARRLWL